MTQSRKLKIMIYLGYGSPVLPNVRADEEDDAIYYRQCPADFSCKRQCVPLLLHLHHTRQPHPRPFIQLQRPLHPRHPLREKNTHNRHQMRNNMKQPPHRRQQRAREQIPYHSFDISAARRVHVPGAPPVQPHGTKTVTHKQHKEPNMTLHHPFTHPRPSTLSFSLPSALSNRPRSLENHIRAPQPGRQDTTSQHTERNIRHHERPRHGRALALYIPCGHGDDDFVEPDPEDEDAAQTNLPPELVGSGGDEEGVGGIEQCGDKDAAKEEGERQ